MRDLLDGYGNVQKTHAKTLFFLLSCVRSSIEIRSAIAAVWKGSHLDMIGADTADMCYAAAIWFEGLLRIMNIKIRMPSFLALTLGITKILYTMHMYIETSSNDSGPGRFKLAQLPGDLKLP